MHPMASFNIIVLPFILILARSTSGASNECPKIQEISCESLRSCHGYTYTVPADIPCSENCEQGWYYQNGTFIVDSTPNAGGKRLSVVVDVTPQKLSVTVCDNLQWQLDCGKCHCIINYTVTDLKHSVARDTLTRNNTSGNEQDDNHDSNDLPGWGIALIVIRIVGGFTLILFIGIRAKCFYKPKQEDVL